MAVFRSCLPFVFLALWSTPSDAGTTCKGILKAKPNSPSGTYKVTTDSGDWISIYCEMGLNGGGYTFLTPMSLISLTHSELQTMFTDRKTFLFRVRKTDGTQPYAVLGQLSPEYSRIPLKLGLNNHDEYSPPRNKFRGTLEPPFLYFGFIPIANATAKKTQGLMINGNRTSFKNCDAVPNSHFALYTNFKEALPTDDEYQFDYCKVLFSGLLPIPSGRVIPPEFFFFGETVWGGCGCYRQTNQLAGINGFSMGFR